MTPSNNDDNLTPGVTYTFQLSLDNYFTLPRTQTVQQDLAANAPNFVSNDVQISVSPDVNPLKNTFNVQFTYNGDGSDVVSDVATAIVSAIKTGSNDNFTFLQAYPDYAANVAPNSISGALNAVGQNLGNAAGTLLDQATKKTADAAQNLLTPVEIAVGILAFIVVVIIFTGGKAGGFSASEAGVSVGGRK